MSKNLPFDLFALIFGDLDAFVDVVGVKVECEEEREKRKKENKNTMNGKNHAS